MQLGAFIVGLLLIVLSCFLLWKLLSEKDAEKRTLSKRKIRYVILAAIVGIVAILFSFSPLPQAFLIGSVFILIGFFSLRRVLYNKNQKKKRKTVICSLILMLGAIMVLASFAPLSSERETEEAVDNIVFKGMDENTIPLAATDIKLVKEEYRKGHKITSRTYKIIATLKKNSADPAESYYDFTIVLVDKNGAYIKKENVSTMPTPLDINDNGNIFTNGSTSHFEHEIYCSSSDNIPVSVEFVAIKEFSKEAFIQKTLDASKNNMDEQNYYATKQYADLILEYEPDNKEAKTLSEEAAAKENGSTTSETQRSETNPEASPSDSADISEISQPASSPTPAPTNNSAKEKSKYLDEIKSNADYMQYYTTELFSDLSSVTDADLCNEKALKKWLKKIDDKVLLIRTYIDDLRSLKAPKGLEEVQEKAAIAASSYYLVTEDVRTGVKNLDGEKCSNNTAIAKQDYDNLLAVIAKFSKD